MTAEPMPAFIEESNELYSTYPAGAAALLYAETRKLRERMPETGEFRKKARRHKSETERQVLLLESDHRLMDWLAEDAEEATFPDSLEWELDVGVAQDIVRITRKYGK